MRSYSRVPVRPTAAPPGVALRLDRQPSQLPRPRAARDELRPVSHLELKPGGVERRHRGDEIQIDDVRAMHPEKSLGVETRLELVHAEVDEIAPAARVDGDVIVIRLEPLDLRDVDRDDAPTIAREDATNRTAGRKMIDCLAGTPPDGLVVAIAHRAPNAFERGVQSVAAERLEQIVDCLELERRHGKPIIRRREHDRGIMLNALEYLEPAQLRHLDIQEHQVRLQRIDELDRRASIARFARDVDPIDLAQQISQLRAGDRFIFDDDGARRHGATTAVAALVDSAGSMMRTENPLPGAV